MTLEFKIGEDAVTHTNQDSDDLESQPALIQYILATMGRRFYSPTDSYALDGIVSTNFKMPFEEINFPAVGEYLTNPKQSLEIRDFLKRRNVRTYSDLKRFISERVSRKNTRWFETVINPDRVRDPILSEKFPDTYLTAIYSHFNDIGINLFDTPYKPVEIIDKFTRT